MDRCLHGKTKWNWKKRNKFVYKFNTNKKYGDEWDHLQEQVK
jgi:hypothetical protein